MTEEQPIKRRRGRPPKVERKYSDTKQELIRSGLAMITEFGFTASGVDAVVKQVQVPKGSFYHYFKSKEAFGLDVLQAYGQYFAKKLDKHLNNETLEPLDRIEAFIDDAKHGMVRFDFRRGCLVGNMMQEVPQLSEALSQELQRILLDWQHRVSHCILLAKQNGTVSHQFDEQVLAEQFWSGWEGAVMRAKLFRSTQPLDDYWRYFQIIFSDIPK
ncbi:MULTISPECIES: acrylate utilization transcriptional regulator AcuR [Vibrio]|uniref:TetR family transcriptional regulator n=2 Tax=Vibrio TaxID=662 RepID=A0A7X4LMK3_9VIBR|nr:TetR/AcrR family transcriptional regulator [Vibrio nitrifigilis]MBF9003022.1 TetR/AcrR family transcriptional regulator [Vibrio nitrifigilis]MZI94535.1 TetR family transcriptional regulator [Vibrio eleionomae]